MIENVFSQIIPLTAAMALPFPVIKATRYLLGGKPLAHSLLFILAWGLICFLALSLAIVSKTFLLIFFGIVEEYIPAGDFTGWIHILLGILFISIGVRKLKRGLDKKDDSVESQSIELSAASIIFSTVRLELFQLKNGLLFFFVFYLILKSQLGVVQSFVASGMISITAMIWVSMPLFVYFLTGRERDRVLELLKEWLMKNGNTLIIFIYIFIGISTLSTGLGELIPMLLDGFLQTLV